MAFLITAGCIGPAPGESSEEVFAEAHALYLAQVGPSSVSEGREPALDRASFAQRFATCSEGEEVRVLREDVRAFFQREDVLELCRRYAEARARGLSDCGCL